MDLDADGIQDVVSGSWPGELYWFRGKGGGAFLEPEMLRDREGKIINVGGGVKVQPDGMILITGHAEWETDEKTGKTVVTYQGKQYESKPGAPVATTGCAAHLHVTDWDGDQDLDLLVGTIRGEIYFIPNEGTRGEWSFGEKQELEVGGTPLRLDGDSGPFTVDWDGDGDLDLLTGGDSGAVWYLENVGSATKPKLKAAEEWIPAGLMAYGDDAPEEVVRGGRSKVCVTDWNEDGLMDLLVGDVSYQRNPPPKLSPEEQEKMDEAAAKLEVLNQEYRKYIDVMFRGDPNRTEDEVKEAREKMQELQLKMSPLRALIPEKTLTHGSVWVFLQKKAEAT